MSVIGSLQPFQAENDDFDKWVEVFDQFLVANGVDKTKTADRAKAIFSSNLGLPTYTLLTDLISPKKVTEVDLDDLVKTLSSHFRPAPKALSERYKFGQRTQQPGETVNTYVS